MRVRLVPASRLPRVPLWALLVVAAWSSVIVASVIAQRWAGTDVSLCAFKQATGLPCPSCGSTRAAESLLRGHPVRAWLYNPLVVTAGAVAAAVLSVRLASARAVKLDLSRREVHVALIVLIALVMANWIYLIVRGY
jgi:hypothetical protein